MTNGRESSQSANYRIRVRGELNQEWSAWFNDLTITPLPHGETLLCGAVVDQPALHGLLARIRDLGLTLLTVDRLEVNNETEE
jgi:hypothetical protein